MAVTLLFTVGAGAAAAADRVIRIVGLRHAFVAVPLLVAAGPPVEDAAGPGSTSPPPGVRFCAYAFLMGAGAAVVFAYLPLYAVERLNFADAAAGALAAVFGVVGLVARL